MEQMNRHDGMPTAAKRKRIPYGLMNFMTLRERDCYYVDKTRFIESIEEANMFFFFIRPRRFGKISFLADCISARILRLSVIPIWFFPSTLPQ